MDKFNYWSSHMFNKSHKLQHYSVFMNSNLVHINLIVYQHGLFGIPDVDDIYLDSPDNKYPYPFKQAVYTGSGPDEG